MLSNKNCNKSRLVSYKMFSRKIFFRVFLARDKRAVDEKLSCSQWKKCPLPPIFHGLQPPLCLPSSTTIPPLHPSPFLVPATILNGPHPISMQKIMRRKLREKMTGNFYFMYHSIAENSLLRLLQNWTGSWFIGATWDTWIFVIKTVSTHNGKV